MPVQGSVGGPYREGGDMSFPTYHFVSTPGESCETYARSLAFQGYGHAPWAVGGNINRLKSHLKNGVSIGDVGYLDQIGQFVSYFNIFDESNVRIQSESLPVKFNPLFPAIDPVEVSRSQLAPGTTIVSKGIDVTRVSEDPL